MRKLIFTTCLALLLVSCIASGDTQEGVAVYFLPPIDAQDASPTAVWTPLDDPIPDAISLLLDGTENYPSPYDEGVRLISLEATGETVHVVFSDEYAEMPDYRRAAADACLALTICGIDSSLEVRVNGGLAISAADILFDGISLEPLAREITLYFADQSDAYVSGETRNVLLRENVALDSFVIEELLKGPNTSGLDSALPKGTRLISIVREGSVCHVNFSEEYRELFQRPFIDELRAIRAVALTLCSTYGIDAVQILCEGERLYNGASISGGDIRLDGIPRTIYLAARDGLERVDVYSDGDMIEALIGGVDGNGFLSPLPNDVALIDTWQSEGIFYVDFSRDLSDNGNTELEEQACRAVALTLVSNFGHTGIVRIEVSGAPYAELTFPR